MASYPGAPVIFPSRSDGTTVFAAHVNGLQDEVAAIEAALLGQIPHEINFGKGVRITGIIGPPTITADQHDYAPVGLATCGQMRIAADALRTITGLSAQSTGRLLLVTNAGSQDIVLAHENVLSAAPNRFFNAAGSSVLLPANGQVWLYYDASSRWRPVVLGASVGGWSDIAYSAGNFAASAGAWTVDVGDQLILRYMLVGKLLTVQFNIQTTSLTAAALWLRIGLPPGLVCARTHKNICAIITNNGVTATQPGMVQTNVGENTVYIMRDTLLTAFSITAANNTGVQGTVQIEVQ